MMNRSLADYARQQIKEGLLKLSEKHRKFYKRLYSHNNRELPIEDVIKNMPDDKLNCALTQVQNTLKEVNNK